VTITRVNVHDYYLGMTLNFNQKWSQVFSMQFYIEGMLQEQLADISGQACSKQSFEVISTNLVLLDKGKTELFHHFVAKILILCKRARP
jgi:hypothetical protein